jgi:hypothetical protein
MCPLGTYVVEARVALCGTNGTTHTATPFTDGGRVALRHLNDIIIIIIINIIISINIIINIIVDVVVIVIVVIVLPLRPFYLNNLFHLLLRPLLPRRVAVDHDASIDVLIESHHFHFLSLSPNILIVVVAVVIVVVVVVVIVVAAAAAAAAAAVVVIVAAAAAGAAAAAAVGFLIFVAAVAEAIAVLVFVAIVVAADLLVPTVPEAAIVVKDALVAVHVQGSPLLVEVAPTEQPMKGGESRTAPRGAPSSSALLQLLLQSVTGHGCRLLLPSGAAWQRQLLDRRHAGAEESAGSPRLLCVARAQLDEGDGAAGWRLLNRLLLTGGAHTFSKHVILRVDS